MTSTDCSSDSIISVKNVRLGYSENFVLESFSWEIKAGELWVVLGPNGVGKTTVLKSLCGQMKTTQGKILCRGQRLDRLNPREIARQISYLPQKLTISLPFSVNEFLDLSMYAWSNQEIESQRKRDSIDRFQLEALMDRSVSTLSGGELQRVLLASIHAQNTELILYDEPFSFLDPKQSQVTLDYIRSQREEGKTQVVVLNSLLPIMTLPHVAGIKALLLGGEDVVFSGWLKAAQSHFEALFERSFQSIKINKMEWKI